uniref:Retrotrans_gag domain-containing protein n=1 Tax=Panagrellus redivivus TaxID=6233 RepID=A0A7E4WCS7_PANRE
MVDSDDSMDDDKTVISKDKSKSFLHANVFNPDPSQATPASDWFEKFNLIWSLEKTSDENKKLGIFKALPQNLFIQVRNRVEGDTGVGIADATADQLKTAMISLFDKRESTFAKRYAALQLEWKGDSSEPTSVFFARLRRQITNFDLSTFKEDQLGTLLLLIAMRAPHLDRVRTLVLTKLREKPTMKLSDCEDLILDHLATAMEQKLPETPSVNQVSHDAKKGRNKGQINGCAEGDNTNWSACIHCGRNHESQTCRFKNAECHTT